MTSEGIRELHQILNRAITITNTEREVPQSLQKKLLAARKELIAHRKAVQGE